MTGPSTGCGPDRRGCSVSTAFSVAAVVCRSNGMYPSRAKNNVAPKAHRSDAGVASAP